MQSLRQTISSAIVDSNKRSKKDVKYSKGMRQSRCGLCEYFIDGDAGDHEYRDDEPNTCKKVKGEISPDMWCELFKKA